MDSNGNKLRDDKHSITVCVGEAADDDDDSSTKEVAQVGRKGAEDRESLDSRFLEVERILQAEKIAKVFPPYLDYLEDGAVPQTSFQRSDAGQRRASQVGAFPVEGTCNNSNDALSSAALRSSEITLEQSSDLDLDVNSNLARAHPVQDDIIHSAHFVMPGSTELRVSQSSQEEPGNTNGRKQKVYLCSALLLLGTCGIVMGVIFGVDSKKPTITDAPSMAPTTSPRHQWVLENIPTSTMEHILYDPKSGQAQAYEWLRADPVLEDYPEWKKLQRFALATFYYATNGKEWTLGFHWLEYDMDECTQWFYRQQIDGRVVDGGRQTKRLHLDSACNDEGRFRILTQTENNLVGSIPPQVGLLTHLEYFDFSSNEGLAGSTVPTQVGLLTNLVRIAFERNLHVGNVPSEIGNLQTLDSLYFGYNPFTGPVPTELGNLGAALKVLDMQRCGVTGTFPTEIYQLTNLQALLVMNMGGITAATLEGMQAMTDIRAFVAHDLPFRGSIPSAIGTLTNLTTLNLWNTGITGSLPPELWMLTGMQRFDIDDNFITGTFPAGLGRFTGLQELWINGNELSGTLPEGIWKNLTQLKNIRMNNNKYMHGTIPSQVGQSVNITGIWFSNLNLTGTIPTELARMTNLQSIFFHDTNIEGTLSTEFASLTDLRLITLSNTSVTGSIPAEVCSSLKDMEITCSNVLGIDEQICTDVAVKNFSCDGSQICGCSCGAWLEI